MGEVVKTESGRYVRPGTAEIISSQRDILNLLALCGEVGTDRLLIPRSSLVEEFFDLSSGLAGEIGLKLSTYRIKTALVVDLDAIPSQRFREWAGECNRGKEIHFCDKESDAVEWLLS